MKLDKKIIKALYESQVGAQNTDDAVKLNQAEQKSFFYIICEFGMYTAYYAYLKTYDKNDKFPFIFVNADNLMFDMPKNNSNFKVTRNGELKLIIGEDYDGEPLTWENLLNSLDSNNRPASKYYDKHGMIGLQTFKTKKEAEDLIKKNEEQMEICARYHILNPYSHMGGGTYRFEVKEYTKKDFERDLKRL